jgi:hypothetical protein
MTQIVNLPALTTITNTLIFPAADTADGNRTKKVTLNQLIALSAGPRGPQGVAGAPGTDGPPGPSGPPADQSVNTGSSVTFQSLTVVNTTTGITFGDGSVQFTAYKKAVQDLVEFSIGNISLTASQITAPILTGSPTVSGRNLYLPTSNASLAGVILIVRNRSNTHTFDTWGGLANLATIATTSAVQIACDGYTWFVV